MKKKQKDRYGALIAAGGSSSRFGADKLFEKIAGVPVFIRSIAPFIDFCSGRIVMVVKPDSKKSFAKIAKEYLPSVAISYVDGGGTRAASVKQGLGAFSVDEIDFVAIHDAARPLLTKSLLESAFQFASKNGSAVFCSRISDTVKYVNNVETGIISKTLNRDHLWAVQTPQIFRFSEIKTAYESARKNLKSFTDDASVMDDAGFEARIFPSPPENIKITYAPDILIAESLYKRLKEK